MKIIYVYPKLTFPAGTERILVDKMNYLADHVGYDVMLVTYEQDNHPIIYPLSQKVTHVDIDVRYYELYKTNFIVRLFNWRNYDNQLKRRFEQIASSFRPDIVIATTYYANIISAIAVARLPFVRILESHIDRRYIYENAIENRDTYLHWFRCWTEKMSVTNKIGKFDVLVTLNDADAADWSKYLKTVIIENIVHLNPTNSFSHQDTKKVIFAGRYTRQKGIDDLLRIWTIVNRKHPDWHLNMYGNGDLSDGLSERASQLQANIHVNAQVLNIFEKYRENTMLLMTSLYEPFGLVIPEAMSCGLPVVAFDCPSGPANILTEGVDGYLIKDRDVNAFAEKVCYLIEHPDVRIEMGKNAIKHSVRYAPERIMPKWISLFKELVGQNK